MADETQDSLRQAINRILGFSPGSSAGTGTSSGVAAPIEGPRYGAGTAEEAIKLAGQTPFSNISGTTSGVAATPGTTNTVANKAAVATPKLPPGISQADYDSPGYQAALAQAKASGGGSVWRRNASPGYVTTKTPNSLGGFSFRTAPAPNVWYEWQAGTPPPLPAFDWNAQLKASQAASNAALTAAGLAAPGTSSSSRVSTPVYPASGTWQQKAQYWKDMAAR